MIMYYKVNRSSNIIHQRQNYGKSMEYPPKIGRNANLKLKIKQLGENHGSWAEG